MLGHRENWVTTQDEILAELLERAGYQVRITSGIASRIPRLLDTLACLTRWSPTTDVVVVSVFSGKAFLVADAVTLVSRALRKPLLLVLHGGGLPEFQRRHPRWLRRVMARGRVLVAPSEYLAQMLRSTGLDVEVIPNGLEIADYPYQKRETVHPRLLWMRTFDHVYNPQMAVEAFTHLRKFLPDASLTMAGQDKGLVAPIRKRVEQNGFGRSVRFAGFLTLEDKRREFTKHEVFLSTNRVDNMPVSLLEAAASGLPLVSTKVGGIPYFLEHGETALLVDDGDAKGMADAVRQLTQDPRLSARLSENGRKLAESCSWGSLLPQWERELNVAFSFRHPPGAR